MNKKEFKNLINLNKKLEDILKDELPKLMHNHIDVDFDKYLNREQLIEKYPDINRSIFSSKIVFKHYNYLEQHGITFFMNKFDVDIFYIDNCSKKISNRLMEFHKAQPRYIWGDKKEDFKSYYDKYEDFEKELKSIENKSGILLVSRLLNPDAVIENAISIFIELK